MELFHCPEGVPPESVGSRLLGHKSTQRPPSPIPQISDILSFFCPPHNRRLLQSSAVILSKAIILITMILRLFPLFLLFSPVLCSPKVRALWNLEEVSECVLHYAALVYNNYGCWCGVGGSHEPVDGIDACCRDHDHCYDAAVDDKKCFDTAWEYVDNYSWQCNNNTAICAAEQDDCKSALCECDVAVVKCWSQFPKPAKKEKCNRTKWFPRSELFSH